MSQLDGNEPLSLAGLDEEFTRYFESLDLNTAEPDIASDAALPQWAMHSLAVRDTVDLVASAAIEGKPNFAICATVGMVLLVDSAVSTGTTLLHEAGVIDWKWRGIPNYAGRGVGLAAAKGWEQATGTEVDEEKWKEIGGVGADIALLFIPDRALGAGLKIGSGGIKVLKGQQLAGKSLRISKYGLDLVNAGRGWHNSVKTAEAVKSLTKVVKGATIVADLIDREKPDTGPSTTTKTPDVPSPIENSIGMVLVPISAGEFLMGSPASEARRIGFETQHRVKLTKSFYLGRTEVTQGQWKAVMGTTPWKGKNFVKEGDDYPANYVDWDDAVEFCRRLSKSQEEKAAGHIYRLPTEAEWEYACRAGTTTDYSFGDDESQLSEYAWCDWNSGDTTHPVGEKKPNPWGLYDMHGNVSEWCQDWYGKYPSANVTDPVGPASGSDRVLRGGNWYRSSGDCRSASSCRGTPFIRVSSAAGGLGFRVVRTSGESSEQPVADVASVQKPLPVAKPVGDPIENSIGMVLVPIPAGEFMMGSPESEAGREDNETQHRVKLTKSFYLGKYEVTQEQYGKVMGKNPSNDFRYFDGLIHKLNPVVGVTWYDAVEFCRKLSALPAEKSSGYVYRLPTEAEWEYACRAGTKTKYCFGDSRSELGEYAWYARDQPHGVGQKHPNSWNLYDMHGNVEEWCQDWYGDYPNAAVTDPAGSSPGYGRVTRGGSWTDYSGSGSFRSAVRGEITSEDAYPNLGFRVLRSSIK
jgi:formylglycine-generating enzyme required for sulfatase activity